VEGHDALVIDDEILTGGTILQAVNVLKAHGAQDIYVAATHAILSGDATSGLSESPIKELVITDTLPVAPEKMTPQMKVVSVAPLLGEAISRIHTGQSVGALFQ
ncbi:MAG TPA: ribose-phosphate pyrophosphokinase, partial [Dehalococcoidia bacterium]|nr:ribose-phosphate pyrophosphokinase [Dehalococcoidia bacterium]